MELLLIVIALILGIIWGLYFKISIALILPCMFLLWIFLKKENKKYILIFTITIIISNIYIGILEKNFENKYKDINSDVKIIGTIISEPQSKKYYTQCILEVERVDENYKYKDTKILLKIQSSNFKIKNGNKVEICGKLEDAEPSRNEGEFNYREYLKLKGIYKITTINKENIKILKQDNFNILSKFINFIREKIKNIINIILPEKEAGFLEAVLIGDKSNIDEETELDFRNSSLSHIMAISGMHVAYVVMGLNFIIDKFKCNKKLKKISIIVFLIFFIFLTGNTPSVERACIMTIYLIIGNLLHKRTNTLNSIYFSAIVILILNPYNLLDIGFELSFLGTLGIVLIYPKLKKNVEKIYEVKSKIFSKIIDILLVTISVNLLILPITLSTFNTISFTFLLSNLLISPFIGAIILLGFISVFIGLLFLPISKILGMILYFFIDIILQIANIIGNFPFSKIYFIKPNIIVILIYYLCIFLLIYRNKINIFKKFNKKQLRRIIVILVIITIIGNLLFIKIIPNDLKIYFIDVGQR